MRIDRKLLVIVALVAIVITSAAATTKLNSRQETYVNLKVLPKDISSRDLQKIMVDDFEDGLGVSCNFCHAADKETGKFDFASDAKPEKEIARSMMRMTIGVNKKYFKIKRPMIGREELTVTCNTCHNGVAFPDGKNAGQ